MWHTKQELAAWTLMAAKLASRKKETEKMVSQDTFCGHKMKKTHTRNGQCCFKSPSNKNLSKWLTVLFRVPSYQWEQKSLPVFCMPPTNHLRSSHVLRWSALLSKRSERLPIQLLFQSTLCFFERDLPKNFHACRCVVHPHMCASKIRDPKCNVTLPTLYILVEVWLCATATCERGVFAQWCIKLAIGHRAPI